MRSRWLVVLAAAFTLGAGGKDDGATDLEAGKAHLRGGPESFSLEKAAARFESACKKGQPLGCTSLALQLQDGRGVPRDLPRAIKLCEKACDDGAGVGCMNRGFMFQGGVVDDPDGKQAAAFFERAAAALGRSCDSGDLQWCTNIGTLYELGLVGDQPDYQKAGQIYRKACQQRMGDWCVNLALLSLYGHLATPDTGGAVALLEKACAARVSLGCGALGRMLVLPQPGMKKDIARGLKLVEGACHDGEVQSCALLGAVYGMGEEVPRDQARADAAETRACLLGDSSGCHALALGSVQARRHGEAARWFERGCDIGNGASCALLGAMFQSGDAVAADAERAAALFTDACRLGDPGSCVELLNQHRPLPLRGDRRRRFLDEACRRDVKIACGMN